MATTAVPNTATSGQPNGPGGRPQIKVGSNPNMNRRGMQSPVDGGANKRNTPHKPWGQQNHAGQQKYQAPSTVNNQKKTAESDTPDKHMKDRTLYLVASCVGKRATVTTKNGSQYSGILAGAGTNGDLGCVLKFAKQVRGSQGEDEQIASGYTGGGVEKTMIFEGKELMDLETSDVFLEANEIGSNQNGTGQFKTDVDISGNQPVRERELQRWQADEGTVGLGLEETSDAPGPEKRWDQFETNERLFGVKSDFDETLYTTKIDTSHPSYKQREAAAARIAKEIEHSTVPGATISAHQAEERGLKVDDSGVDEEDKYSSVHRAPPSTTTASGAQKYMPPALRAQVSAPAATSSPAPKEPPKEPALEAKTETPSASQPAPKAETTMKKTVPVPAPAIPVIPVITEQAPSPQPPSVSSFKSDEPKPKALLPESVKKASVTTIPAVPAFPLPKGPEAAQASTTTSTNKDSSDNPILRVKDAFQQFTNIERTKVEKRRQAIVRQDKDVKLQDLRRFAQSFKLNTPVPQDLVPILAKDKAKQDEIIEKSKVNAAAAHVKKQSPTSQTATGATPAIQANLRTPIPAPPMQSTNPPVPVPNQGISAQDKNGINKAPIPGFPPRHPAGFRADRPQPLPANMNLPTAQNSRMLADKIRHNQQMKLSGQSANMPVPIPVVDHSMPPTGPAAMQPKAFSPTGPKPNPRATEFRPNPFAATFTPVFTAPAGPATSPTPVPSTGSRATSPSVFFGSKKPKAVDERSSMTDAFDPFKRTKLAAEQNKEKPPAAAGKSQQKPGVIDKPWLTLPTWPVREENKEKKYTEVFEKNEPSSTTGAAPPNQPHQSSNHQHSHPPHPAGNPIPTHISQVPHMPHDRHPGPHIPGFSGPQHFGDHEHHGRHVNSPPNVLPSPSMQNSIPSQFGSPGPHHAMVYPNHQGQMPPQYGVLGQNNQFGGYRGGYGAGPQFMPPGGAGAGSPMIMGAQGQQPMPFMVPGMGAPFMQQGMPQGMYSPHQMHAYPGQPTGPPPPPSGGYPSPGRGAPSMMHQSSQQGHQTPVPVPMTLSMSSGPAGHPPQQHMMRPFHPPHFNQHLGGQHHPQNQFGQFPGGRGGGHPHHNPMPSHPSGPPANIPHENTEESK